MHLLCQRTRDPLSSCLLGLVREMFGHAGETHLDGDRDGLRLPGNTSFDTTGPRLGRRYLVLEGADERDHPQALCSSMVECAQLLGYGSFSLPLGRPGSFSLLRGGRLQIPV